MAIGKFQEYALPQDKSGLMRPMVDKQDRLWFGEMNRNYLGSFDAKTGKFWQGTPPNGKSGIMGIVADPDGTIWFAEQYANYIGHYFPQTGQYTTYPLPMVTAPDASNPGKTLTLPGAPNDLVLDAHGVLWFTELNAGAIGSLNTANGALKQFPLADANSAHTLDPYGLTVDAQGQVWFSETSSTRLGQLNPLTGNVRYFSPSGIASPLMELVSDPQGNIWATNFGDGQLLEFHPKEASFTIYHVPTMNGSAGGIYGLLVAKNGDIWVAVTSENLLARLEVKRQRFFSYPIPTPNSQPIGLVEGTNGAIWFTESGSNKIGMLQP
jgi:streptogramin lyase